MALTLGVPASARGANFQLYPHFSNNSISIRPSAVPRRRRWGPIGTLTLALAAHVRLFLCAAASSPSPPLPPSPQQVDEQEAEATGGDAVGWGKVSAVLFDMDGVLCNSEESSRMAAVDVFAEMGVSVTADDFVPFMGTGEANFLGGVASVKGVKEFDSEVAKKRFFGIYLEKYAKPNSGIGFPGALELITECKRKGLKVAVASSADRIKVDANLAAAGLPTSLFDAIVSADAFENLKPAPDIFLAAAKSLNVPPSECLVIEDAIAGVQAAIAANMRCIAVTTTLSEERLQKASPSIVRKDIEDVTIHDILNGGSSCSSYQKSQNHQNIGSIDHSYAEQLEEKETNEYVQDGGKSHFTGRFEGSRRDILRYGSLAIAVSCLVFTLSNWKAMQYASLKGILNVLSGDSKPIFGQNEGQPQSPRVQQLKNYISDLESRGTAPTMPEFPSKIDWLNTAPLQFGRNLKGKVVLLDFWTYCCINCMHVLPDLEFLERKYADKPFTVIGVHSAKFDNEKDLEAIRNAVLRYNITHPVVNDGDMYLWRELGVNSWPTFVVVGPNRKILAQLAGEGHRKDLDDFIDAALQFYMEKNLLGASPIPLALEKDDDPRLLTSPLKFPGKLATDVLNNRIFISDSNHNRIVVTDLYGNFIVQVGSSAEEALRDGSFDDACFNHPQGLAYNPKKNTLYVADTENHALREIDFVNEVVRTLAGNGTQGSDYSGGGNGSSQVLNSPWDVCYNTANEKVYIAMAGQHQIWIHNTSDGSTKAFSGDGYERNLNGSSSANTSFAQPSGISLSPDSQVVYVADSESSSIRSVDVKSGGSRLLAGGDPIFPDNLFRFGDNDGIGSDALFQHPLGVFCSSDGQVYIADSYNHKIKPVDTPIKPYPGKDKIPIHMSSFIDETLSKKERDELIFSQGNILMTKQHMIDLLYIKYTSDVHIDTYAIILSDTCTKCPGYYKPFLYVSSNHLYYAKYGKDEESNYFVSHITEESVKEAMYIVMPIIQHDHWTLLMGEIKSKQWLFFDSLPNPIHKAACKDPISLLAKQKGKLFRSNITKWPVRSVRGIPTQSNSVDCGVFLMKYMEAKLRSDKVNWVECQNWQDEMEVTRAILAFQMLSFGQNLQ